MGSLSVGDTLLLVPEKKDIVYYQNGNELRRIVGVVDYSENKVTIDTILNSLDLSHYEQKGEKSCFSSIWEGRHL